MTQRDKRAAFSIYLYLGALFITSLVVSNLIFQKFFHWNPFGEVTVFGAPLFELSVGILPYPVTFLITDLVSEVYGQKKANQVVTAGIFASFFSMGIILLANFSEAIPSSPVDDVTFTKVFGLSPLGVLASMLAYLAAQYIDIKIYHYWKKVTDGRMLWLRNNFSTFSSQFIDTLTVITLLCLFGVLPWDKFYGLLVSGVIFKIIIAVLDTPFLYFFVYLMRKRFNLKIGEEISLD
ncbi:queuosine precursor transporter [Flagellimonas aequoris]|uniref:Probable queuosine precursor transporter n=1 Tax=Flagellimonas aequoris TaxID=2306997 RepID=A0A418NBA3_9FLAO|nr:queuosine precursor transporter [Allomuricauda aequoris]RIV73858.1 VUT family protein [Allomuricauda aequoris]TXK07545.1 queuosine precursor transporter [Allomuricauda aequoris]